MKSIIVLCYLVLGINNWRRRNCKKSKKDYEIIACGINQQVSREQGRMKCIKEQLSKIYLAAFFCINNLLQANKNMTSKISKGKKPTLADISKRHSQILLRELQRKEKFYLVGITGRTSFILENMHGYKFKITIGNQLKCSCAPEKQLHCIHTIYILTEIFYLPTNNELLLKSKYSSKQLRYIIANRIIHSNKISDFLKCTKNRMPRVIMEEREEDEDDQPENLCAICQMEIVKQDATTACEEECGNAFHLDCFMQWAKHQVNKNGVIACPLCRAMKPAELLSELKKKQSEYKQTLISQKVGKQFYFYCDGCQLKQIKSQQAVYKCIVCEDVTLCQTCFNLGKHMKHSFIYKINAQQKWMDCEDRKRKKKLDEEMGLIRMKIPQSKHFFNFLAASLPCFFSKTTRWNVMDCKKLDIKVEELQCIVCNDKRKAFLRRMKCGHFIHHKCLRKRIEKGLLFCKLDGQKFLLGYGSLLKHEKLNKDVQAIGGQEESEQQQKYEKQLKPSPSKSLRSTNTSTQSRKKNRNTRSLNNKSFLAMTRSFTQNPE